MSKRTKYNIIANSISSYNNPIARRRGAESIMIYAIKYVIAKELRDLDMPILCNNNYYEALKALFDTVGNYELLDVLSKPNDPITCSVKAMITRPRRRNIRRAKKQISRVYRDFKRARKQKLFGDIDKNYDFAIKAICNAAKEAFIIVRKSIHPCVHGNIDNAEEVVLPSVGEAILLNSLFVERENMKSNNSESIFALEKQYNFDDAHAIQYKLSKYSFKYYFKRKKKKCR